MTGGIESLSGMFMEPFAAHWNVMACGLGVVRSQAPLLANLYRHLCDPRNCWNGRAASRAPDDQRRTAVPVM